MKELDADDVCALIALARRFQMPEQSAASWQQQGGVPGDDSEVQEETGHPVLAEDSGDPVEQEIRSLVRGLGAARQHELVALMWLGRGDAGPEEFGALVQQARDDLPAGDVSDYLLAHPQLAEYLGGGLAHFGYSCDE